jgi:hypothetical protein
LGISAFSAHTPWEKNIWRRLYFDDLSISFGTMSITRDILWGDTGLREGLIEVVERMSPVLARIIEKLTKTRFYRSSQEEVVDCLKKAFAADTTFSLTRRFESLGNSTGGQVKK